MNTPILYKGDVQLGVWKYLDDINLPAVFGCVSNQAGIPVLNGGFPEIDGAAAACAYVPTPPSFRMFAPDAASSSFTIAVEMLSGDATIDWGDGSPTESLASSVYDPMTIILSTTASHNYGSFVGAAEIKVSGDIGRIQIIGAGITEVLQYGNYNHFMLLLPNLVTVPSALPSTVNDMTYMFASAASFNQLLNYNTTNVQKMFGTFAGASSYDQPITFSTPNVTTLSYFLANATAYNQPLLLSDVSKVTTVECMLLGATNFNKPFAGWVTTSLENMTDFLKGALAFNQPLNHFITVNVTTMKSMLDSAESFNQPLDQLNVSNVLNMDALLKDTPVFDQDLSGWCVTNIPTEPTDFGLGSAITTLHKPIWGTCPG